MDQLSKIVSLSIGLIIVVIAFAVFTGRVNLGNGFPNFLSKSNLKITITPTPQPKFNQLFENSSPELKQSAPAKIYSDEKIDSAATSIPATGSPTEVIALAISMFAMGTYLRKVK